MTGVDALGIYREERFSPGKVEDDRAILDATADRLRAAGARVAMIDGGSLPPRDVASVRLVFAMCQGERALAWLDELDCRVVNAAAAIRNCFRANLVRRLAASAVPQPRWEPATERFPTTLGAGPWLKRGDVHAMQAGDVRRILDERQWRDALGDLARRGVVEAIAQQHRDGEVYKFYGVAGGFFRAFGLPAGREDEAAALAFGAARALGLEVFGGDGVAPAEGELTLIDVNDWPSFSRCRADAATAIGRHLCHLLESAR